MAKITDLRDRFRTAVTDHANVMTYIDGYVYEINDNSEKEFPVLLFSPPDSVVSNYKAIPFEVYSCEFWIFRLNHIDDAQDDWEKWEQLKDWGYDIIDSVISKSTRPADYDVSGNVGVTLYPAEANDDLIAVKFTLSIQVKDCRNMT